MTVEIEDGGAVEPIAICGMACKVPGGVDSASSLWKMLLNKESGQTSKVPASRFNIDAYYHNNIERPGSFNIRGGYFLDQDVENFDPTFFNITPIEAMWLDPQQRKMLEVCYEALESAGLSLSSVSGTNCAVIAGSFTTDFQQMSTKEPDFRHNYAGTGGDPGLISNRVGHAFNLKGPSCTINTACSSSVYAAHIACQALRARDCEAALVGGVNLILSVDQHMNTAKLGILSPTSICHTFDASADGYGRSEGVGALYLKRLSDAIRDGDPVRGVIRSSAVNSNGKVTGMAITHPSIKGQEMVMRHAYKRAHLNPKNTAYLECHGTGTPVGDPIEVQAASQGMNDTRSKDKPLLLGAIKANIGHSEAASGIFAIMKAAMMTETGVIPGVCGLRNVNPALREKEWNVKIQADTIPWPKDFSYKRASVSSFGYGGTNGHVIIENVDALYPGYSHGKSKGDASYNHSTSRPLLVGFSAHDKPTLIKNINSHAKVADKFFLADLAYTLNIRRSRFPQRAFTVAIEGHEVGAFDINSFKFGVKSKRRPEVGFIFTGQGAQWATMSTEAIQQFPLFRKVIRSLDSVLKSSPNPPSWSLEQELIAPAEKSRLSTAEIAQPACTAIQIAIVDLFASWNIVPSVTVGHSSGEMAAAYAAGLVSAPEAMLAAYYRGYALMRHAPAGGTMLAVGLGPAEVADMIPDLGNEVQLACENSPSSVTLSGPVAAIKKAKTVLDAKGIFVRELSTGQAYHSSYMKVVAQPFVEYLSKAFGSLCQKDLGWRRPVTKMISSVSAAEVIQNEINEHYWAANLTSRVRFSDAVAALGSAPDPGRVKLMIEIGPHSALAGPFRQICKANEFKEFYYVPSLVRNSNCSVSLLRTAGELFLQDHPVDLERVNAVEQIGQSSVKATESFQPLTLVDLPPYQWNYERRYWAESRLSHEQRQRKQTRHDILGSRFVGLSDRNHTWRNVLRHRDIPWLKDHRLGDSTIVPAAGHIALAVEAVRQICEESSTEIAGVTLRDVDIKTALVVPEVDEGIEIQVRVSPIPKSKGAKLCYAFTVESLSDQVWKLHCAGIVIPIIESAGSRNDTPHPFDRSILTQSVQPKQWYDAFSRVGFKYGPSFQKLGTIKTNNRYHSAAADIILSTESGMMDGESRYILHPSTVDACLQLVIISSYAGLHQEMPWGVVPISMEEISLYFPRHGKKDQGNAVAWTDEIDGRYFNTQVKMMDADDNLLLEIKSVRCIAYEAAVPAQAQVDIIRQPYSAVIWKPDISTLSALQAIQVCSDLKSESNAIIKMVELIDHKQPLRNILLLAFPSEGIYEAIIASFPADAAITAVGICDLAGIKSMSQDLVIVAKELLQGTSFDTILPLIKPVFARKGKLILSVNGSGQDVVHGGLISSGFAPPSLRFDLPDTTVILSSPEPYLNGIKVDYGRVMLMTTNAKDPKLAELVSFLSEDCDITVNHINDYNLSSQTSAIIFDFDGKLLEDMEPETFIGIKKLLCSGAPMVWVTAGVENGTNALGGMSKGLLRSIRAEESNAKVSLLDVDEESSICSIGAAILKKLHHISGSESGADNEFWLHNGIFYINRIVPNSQINAQFNFGRKPPQVAVLEPGRSLRGEVADGEVIFAQMERSALGIQEVELQVDCFSMEEKTIQTSSSAVKLAAGQILKAGGQVTSSLVGQKALVYSSEPFSTLIRTSHTLCVPFSQHDSTLLVATLPSLCRAINALGISQLNSRQHVLLLEPSPFIIKTFRSLCHAIGLTMSVFESVHEFRKFISQNFMPVTVIAHNFSSLSQEVWRYMPSMGRFILNESVIHDTPDALPFTRGASFTSTSLATLHKHDAEGLCKLLRKSLELLESYPELLVQDPKVVDISEAGTATESSQVVKYGYSLSRIKVRPSRTELRLSPDSSYLLVGCLGGIGRSLATFMMEKGARNFVFISRSGTDKLDAKNLVSSLTEAGANVQVFRADASNACEVARIVSEVSSTSSIRGVVHAAMVVQDGMFGHTMTVDMFNAAIVPKVKGANALHQALKDHSLDFFIMTSSVSGTKGSQGQANYGAANTYLDTLAWHRHLKGLPATSLVLPMILEVGAVAETEGLEAKIARKAIYGIGEREMLRGFETAMLQPAPKAGESVTLSDAQIILGIEPQFLANAIAAVGDSSAVYWFNDARFSKVRRAIESVAQYSNPNSGNGDFMGLVSAAQQAGHDTVIKVIGDYLMKKCSGILMVPISDFEYENGSIASYGLDSMIGPELRNWLYREFGLNISFQLLLAPTLTFRGLSIKVGEILGVIEKS